MNRTATMEDPVLLEIAQAVFGADLVVRAWVETYDYGNDTQVSLERRLHEGLFQRPPEFGGELDYDDTDIVLEFNNGRRLRFWASEWAGIKLVKEAS